MEYRRGQRKRTGVSVFVGTDETTNATGSVLELWVTRSYYKIKNIFFSNDFRIDPQFLHLWISYALFKWKDFQLIFFSCFFIWFSYVCDMVLTCFSPVSFFDVFHVTCFINFIISLSGQYFKQLSPYFCRHSESASKGKVVLATAPKQHCNVEWCPPDSPPQGGKNYWHTKIYVCLFFCVLLCVRCWNSHVVRKWLQALLAWSGAHGSHDQGTGVFILHVVCHHQSAQENTACDKWHTTYHQFAWWLVVVVFCLSCNFLKHGQAVKAFANNSQRWISIAPKISGWCGNCLQFMWCGYCLQFQFMYDVYVYIFICILYVILYWDDPGFNHVQKQSNRHISKVQEAIRQHSFKRVDSGHLDADICVSVEPQQVFDRCTAWRMWPIAIARKRRLSSFTLKRDWENGSWRLPFALMLCVFFPFVFSDRKSVV